MEPWRPKGSPKVAKGRPHGPLVSFLFQPARSGDHSGRIWGGFEHDLERFGGRFWEDFGRVFTDEH